MVHTSFAISHILTSLILIAVSIPLVFRKVGLNRWYGFRFSKSYESDELWYKINIYGGRQMIIWSIPLWLLGIGLLFIPIHGVWVPCLALAPLIVLVPIYLSWRYARSL